MRTPDTLKEIRSRCRDFGIERISLALLYADDPINRDLEREAIRNVEQRIPRVVGVMAAAILKLLGEDQKDVADFLERKTLSHPESSPYFAEEEAAVEFLTEQMNAQELLAAARGDEQKLALFQTLIGISELASQESGTRPEQHLQQAVEVNAYSWAHHYSRAILARLRDNPAWPRTSSKRP